MLANLSNRFIKTVKLKDKPYEVRDSQLKGLLLRVEPGGTLTYYLQYARGKRVKLGHGDAITAEQAREICRGKLAEVYKGEDITKKVQGDGEQTYLQFLENYYKDWLDKNIRSGKKTFDRLKNSFPGLHDLKLSEINTFVVEQWRTKRKGIKDTRWKKEEDKRAKKKSTRNRKGSEATNIKPATINRELSDLRACLNRAVEWGILSTHPLAKFKPDKTDRSPKVRFLSIDEEANLRHALDEREQVLKAGRKNANEWRAERGYALFSDLDNLTFVDHLKPAVLMSLNTGLRRKELLTLKWSDIDFQTKILSVDSATAKSGRGRHIQLNSEALDVLRQLKEQPGIKSIFVFPGKNGEAIQDMRTSWERVLREAGIKNFRWHDLRHSFASKLVMAGVNLNTVRELLGHGSYAMTLKYAHLDTDHKFEAVNKLVTFVPTKVNKQSSGKLVAVR